MQPKQRSFVGTETKLKPKSASCGVEECVSADCAHALQYPKKETEKRLSVIKQEVVAVLAQNFQKAQTRGGNQHEVQTSKNKSNT